MWYLQNNFCSFVIKLVINRNEQIELENNTIIISSEKKDSLKDNEIIELEDQNSQINLDFEK